MRKGELVFLNLGQIYGIKNHSIWISIRGEIKEQNLERKFVHEEREMTKIHKIKLIYASKLKSNIIGQKIKKKTCNLTQNHARNDPINSRTMAFSLCVLKATNLEFKRQILPSLLMKL